MSTIQSYFKKGMADFNAYSPVYPPLEISSRLGIPADELIKLDANENPYGTSDIVRAALANCPYHSVYPDPSQRVLRKAIAKYCGLEAENIIVGAGGDEILDLIFRLFIEPGDRIAFFSPTFSYYAHLIKLNSGQPLEISRDENLKINPDGIEDILAKKPKLFLMTNPNNPTGDLCDESILKTILESGTPLVLDEAYFEFSGVTKANWIKIYPNLMIVRTFSKFFGLAGLRIGYGILPSELTETIMRFKPPFSVSFAAEYAVMACLEEVESFKLMASEMIVSRDEAIKKISAIKGFIASPSESNFFLVRCPLGDSIAVKNYLEKKGILVRYFSHATLLPFIRISVGKPEQMNHLISVLKDY